MRFLGFVTRTDFNDVPNDVGVEGDVAVYLPMSYQMGFYGFPAAQAREAGRHVTRRRDAIRADGRAQVEAA
jgi:hypothetical protein